MQRRTFLKQTTALTAFSTVQINAQTADFPIVLSTWKNEKANDAAWESLKKTGRALDAVEAGARIPEADPNDTSVGYGGFPDRDGIVTLDACIMDEKGNAGSVTFLQNIMHPISVARAIMEKTPHVMLSGEGALQFALSQGFKKENLLDCTLEISTENYLQVRPKASTSSPARRVPGRIPSAIWASPDRTTPSTKARTSSRPTPGSR